MTAEENNRQHMIDANEMLDRFENILKSRKVPLEVQNLDLKVFTSSQVFGVLPFIKANSLKVNRTFQGRYPKNIDTVALDGFPKCETVKNIEHLGMYSFLMTNPISDFSNIPELFMWRERPHRDDILTAKQAFLTNSHLKKWEVKFQTWEDYGIIHDVLGRPHKQAEWYFKMPNSDEVLYIYYNNGGNIYFPGISFTRIDFKYVPKNALLRLK
ncbi:unnamed protein product [Caenorhabditis nigoni]